jgi:hypothetical protein
MQQQVPVPISSCRVIITRSVAAKRRAARITTVFDSGCGMSISGVAGRLLSPEPSIDATKVYFTNSTCRRHVHEVGYNSDGKLEYFDENMERGLVLLSAYDYVCDGGAAVLYGDGGGVYKLSSEEQTEVKQFMSRFVPSKELRVRKNMYCVVAK